VGAVLGAVLGAVVGVSTERRSPEGPYRKERRASSWAWYPTRLREAERRTARVTEHKALTCGEARRRGEHMHARVTEHKALTRARRAAQRHKGRQRPSNGRRTGHESHVIKESRAPARRIGRGAEDERRQRRARTPSHEPIVPNEGGHQKPSEVIRGHHKASEVIRGNQKPSEVIRGHQWSSEVIRGHQWSSEAIIRGNHRRPEWRAASSSVYPIAPSPETSHDAKSRSLSSSVTSSSRWHRAR